MDINRDRPGAAGRATVFAPGVRRHAAGSGGITRRKFHTPGVIFFIHKRISRQLSGFASFMRKKNSKTGINKGFPSVIYNGCGV